MESGLVWCQLVIGDRTVSPDIYEVGAGFRNTLELPLIAGRDFSPEDHLSGAPRVAWLSHRFWQREFGGDVGVVGRAFRIEGTARGEELRIVGILGPEVASFDLNNNPPISLHHIGDGAGRPEQVVVSASGGASRCQR